MTVRFNHLGLLAVVLPALACGQERVLQFTDVTADAGLTAFHVPPNTPTSLRDQSGGGAVGDFNNDGWPDLLVLRSGPSGDHLYINKQDGTFENQASAMQVGPWRYSVGAAVGDIDDDGFDDIFITSFGGSLTQGAAVPGAHALLMNLAGSTFVDRAQAAGVATTTAITPDGFGAAFGDYDLDGDLDLVVCSWHFQSGGNKLFRNDGNGSFVDVTDTAIDIDLLDMHGFTPRFCDMNGDRYPELLFASDFVTSRYLVNNRDGSFSDFTAASRTSLETNGMGQTVGDFDNDGDPDWYVTSIYSPLPAVDQARNGNMLYINQGDDTFTEISQSAQVSHGWWGWGTAAADFDHDGLLDIAETNGWSWPPYIDQSPRLFLSNGDLTFTDCADLCNLDQPSDGRGIATLDYDRDGDMDLVFFSNRGPVQLFRNELSGKSTHWLIVELDTRADRTLAPRGVGARVSVRTGDQSQHRWVEASGNYLAQSQTLAHFGTNGAVHIDELTVEWPNGNIDSYSNVAVNQAISISACPADFNRNGLINSDDFFDYLAVFFGTVESAPVSADLTFDGMVDTVDLLHLIESMMAGCPRSGG